MKAGMWTGIGMAVLGACLLIALGVVGTWQSLTSGAMSLSDLTVETAATLILLGCFAGLIFGLLRDWE